MGNASATQTVPADIPASSWTEKQAAGFLGVSVEFLQRDRLKRRRVPFIKLGWAVRYDPADVIAYRERCKVRDASSGTPPTHAKEP